MKASIEAAVAAINTDLTARGYSPLDDEQVAAMNARFAPHEACGMLDDPVIASAALARPPIGLRSRLCSRTQR